MRSGISVVQGVSVVKIFYNALPYLRADRGNRMIAAFSWVVS
jgi:hypothetical protein